MRQSRKDMVNMGNKRNTRRIGSSSRLPRPLSCRWSLLKQPKHLFIYLIKPPRRFLFLPPFFVILLRSTTSTKLATNIVSRRCNVDQATPSKAQLHPALSSIEKANWWLCSQSHVEDIYGILGPPDPRIPATHSETQVNLFDLSK